MSALLDHEPVTFRGLTGWDEHRLRVGIGFSTFDGAYHQFVLSDLDLRRLGQAISLLFPHYQFGPHDQSDTGFHSASVAGSRGAAEAADGASEAAA